MKIRGNTVGTPMRPEKAVLVAAEAMTEEQKAQVRENIGAASAESIGDIETALDTIIAIQEELINNGGGSSGGYDENACPNCGEALDSDGYCPNYCKDMESTFYVNGTPHKFHIPMTWEDFVNSGYNRKGLTCGECGSTGNDEFYTTDESVYYFTGSCCGIGYVDIKYDDENWEFVSPNSEIESEHFYIW